MNEPIKNALILGASSSMGNAIGMRLIASGVAVFLTYNNNAKDIQALIDFAVERDQFLGAFQLDAKNIEAMEEILIATFLTKPLHIVINCIGIAEITSISDSGAMEKWNRSVSVNLNFLFAAAHFTLPLIQRSGWGRWINISSVSAFEKRAGVCCYSVTKSAQNKLIQFMAQEAGPGITVNSICPGMTNTPHLIVSNQCLAFERNTSVKEVEESILRDTYTKQFIELDEISELAFYLCSDSARSITGQSIIVAGGRG